jgi:hypothetical protein
LKHPGHPAEAITFRSFDPDFLRAVEHLGTDGELFGRRPGITASHHPSILRRVVIDLVGPRADAAFDALQIFEALLARLIVRIFAPLRILARAFRGLLESTETRCSRSPALESFFSNGIASRLSSLLGALTIGEPKVSVSLGCPVSRPTRPRKRG